MIHLVTAADYPAYRRELKEMHRLRCRVFKDRLGWDVAVSNGLERDQFDRLEPIYLLAIDEQKTVVGSWRFLFTTGPYMLRDVFPQLLDGRPAPHDIGIWEGSRFAVERSCVRGGSLASVSQVAGELLCAVVETCMAAGVRELITVYDARMARLLHRMGCPPRWQSSALSMGRTSAMAGHFDMTLEVLERIRAAIRRANPEVRPQEIRPEPRFAHRGHSHGARHVRQQSRLHRLFTAIERSTARPAPPAAVP
ncbi:MAG: acyl-homoserine-lactone synthase [Kiloniellales bacterium]